jgi:hypothetical protein
MGCLQSRFDSPKKNQQVPLERAGNEGADKIQNPLNAPSQDPTPAHLREAEEPSRSSGRRNKTQRFVSPLTTHLDETKATDRLLLDRSDDHVVDDLEPDEAVPSVAEQPLSMPVLDPARPHADTASTTGSIFSLDSRAATPEGFPHTARPGFRRSSDREELSSLLASTLSVSHRSQTGHRRSSPSMLPPGSRTPSLPPSLHTSMYSQLPPELLSPTNPFFMGELERHVGEPYVEPVMEQFISGVEPLSEAERNELWRLLAEDVLHYEMNRRGRVAADVSALSGFDFSEQVQPACFAAAAHVSDSSETSLGACYF